MKVLWSKESLHRLREIEEFIAQDNGTKAIEFTNFMISKSVLIENNPNIGRVVPEFANPQIRELIIKGYRLIYKISENKIDILTVFEGHRLIRESDVFQEL